MGRKSLGEGPLTNAESKYGTKHATRCKLARESLDSSIYKAGFMTARLKKVDEGISRISGSIRKVHERMHGAALGTSASRNIRKVHERMHGAERGTSASINIRKVHERLNGAERGTSASRNIRKVHERMHGAELGTSASGSIFSRQSWYKG